MQSINAMHIHRWSALKRVQIILSFLLVSTYLLAGCATNRATATVSPSVDLAALKSMYVKLIPSDNSGVGEEIASKLRTKGVVVKTGAEDPKEKVDAIVTYIDKWHWDITLYMLALSVSFREFETNIVMANGSSLHTSLTRLSQTEMIEEVIGNIYNNAKLRIIKTAN